MDFEDVSGPRWGLRSSRVSNKMNHDDEEREGLLGGGKIKKTRGKTWKAKAEDYDDFNVTGSIQLKPSSGPREVDQCVEAEVQPGDTLQSISLKYNLPLAELKRVNNLLNEAEFFALKRIKIPVKPHSLLTEVLPTVTDGTHDGWIRKSAPSGNNSGITTSSSTVISSPSSERSDLDFNDLATGTLVDLGEGDEPRLHNKQSKKVNKFLKNVDKDVQRIKEKQDQLISGSNGNGELSMSTLTSSGDFTTTKLAMPVPSHGRHYGSWCSREGLMCLALIVIAVVVILVLAMLTYHSEMFVSHSDKTVHHEEHLDEAPHPT